MGSKMDLGEAKRSLVYGWGAGWEKMKGDGKYRLGFS